MAYKNNKNFSCNSKKGSKEQLILKNQNLKKEKNEKYIYNFAINNSGIYNLIDLINNLEKTLSIILKYEVNDTKLSNLLGMGDRYVYRIKQEIKDKAFYSVTEKTISKWKTNLINALKHDYEDVLNIIVKFQQSQKQVPFAHRSSLHPQIKDDYFDIINTKEKAYWLGLLYADGNLGKDDRITLVQNFENSILVYRFAETIGFNIDKIEIHENENKVLVRIGNKRLAAGLKKYGIKPAKSKIIELPNFENRELNLAFLLGYYDGDGTINTSRITTGSLKFLEQIKAKYKIKNKIRTRKGAFDLHLGSDLFNEMLENYEYSLPRKRIKLQSSEERNQRLLQEREKVFKKAARLGGLAKRKLYLSKEELQDLLSYTNVSEIAEKYSVAKNTVYRRIKELNIKLS